MASNGHHQEASPYDQSQRVLLAAIERLFAPIANIAVVHRLPYKALADKLKATMARSGAAEEPPDGYRRQTLARVAMITGLPRNAVAQETDKRASPSARSRSNALIPTLVVEGWRRDPAFQDESGNPAVLSIDQGKPSFKDLVKHYGKDVPWKTLLKELEAAGTVERTESGELYLAHRRYIPAGRCHPHGLHFLGEAGARHLATLVHNLLREESEPQLHERRVTADSVPPEHLPELREELRQEAKAFLDGVTQILEKYEDPPAIKSYHVSAGIGMYYFEGGDDD